MTAFRKETFARGGAALALAGLASAGCGGGGNSTGPSTPSAVTPANFDFGSNTPLTATAFGDSITLGELGSPGLSVRGTLRVVTSKLVTSNNYPNNLQNMLRGLDPRWRVINRGVGGEVTAVGAARIPGVLAADKPGFILNALLVPFNNDAIRAVEAGVADAASIDKAIKTALGYKMGPLELIDLIGLDTQIRLCEAFYPITFDPRAACPPLLRRMVAAGLLGRKSGHGFYTYAGNTMFGAS